MTRLAAVDAQTFWMSRKIPNDQFVLYAFDGPVGDTAETLVALRSRAQACPDLRLRVVDDCKLRYPRWVSGPVQSDQLVWHDGEFDWVGCLDAVAGLAADQLDPRRAGWRLHLFGPVYNLPTGTAVATVAVLQMSHALADGGRTAELAGWLFGRADPVPALAGPRRGNLLLSGIAAARADRQFGRDIEAGHLAAPPPPRPTLPTNARPLGTRRIRTLVRDRAALAGSGTVTVAALLGVGTALAGQLRSVGVEPEHLGAEVPMAKPGIRTARNHFRNVGVGLYPDLPTADRVKRITAELRAGRDRAQHPASQAAADALASTPAALLRWGVAQFDPTVRAPVVTGHTVLSSVNRGPADLYLGSARVVLTASFPALSPMMGLTHGVHGIGETIAISVYAADSVLTSDRLVEYVDRLDHALGEPHWARA